MQYKSFKFKRSAILGHVITAGMPPQETESQLQFNNYYSITIQITKLIEKERIQKNEGILCDRNALYTTPVISDIIIHRNVSRK